MNQRPACPRCGARLEDRGPLAELCAACLLRDELEAAPPRPAGPGNDDAELEAIRRDFPKLEIVRLIGRGGMGLVYEARQPRLDRRVALKILLPELAHDPAFAERFLREARSLAKLTHPNAVMIYDFGQRGDRMYFLMEFVDGASLRELLETGPVEPSIALRLVQEVCEGLQYAHDSGIVHRDIKPENILIDEHGHAKIADFGLVRLLDEEEPDWRLTRASQVMGTPQYMAPEQIHRPREVDHRADLYSLGVVLSEMLTGELPIGRFAKPSERVRVNQRVDELVLRLLEREPDQRFRDARELSDAAASIETKSPPPPPRRPASDGDWPTARRIPFRNEVDRWGGLIVWYGLLGIEGDELVIEYRSCDCLEIKHTESVDLRIPLEQIAALECQARWFTPNRELKLIGRSLASFGDYPTCQPGSIRFYVKRAHRRDLTDFVEVLRDRIARSA